MGMRLSLVLALVLLTAAVTSWTGLDGEKELDYSNKIEENNNNNIENNNDNDIESLLESQEMETDDDDTGNGHSDDNDNDNESDADISDSENNEFVDPAQFVG